MKIKELQQEIEKLKAVNQTLKAEIEILKADALIEFNSSTQWMTELERFLNYVAEEVNKLSAIPVRTIRRSKSIDQADRAVALMKTNDDGVITRDQLQEINPRYPTDPIYYARKFLGIDIITERGKSRYRLPKPTNAVN